MKAVLMSIRPKWCEPIASGEKTIEVRKTAPKLDTPFKVYIYCTKDYSVGEFYTSKHLLADPVQGKVIGEFVCEDITDYNPEPECGGRAYFITDDDFEKTCLTLFDELVEYGKGATLYGWHISNLAIYDKPKELSEFSHTQEYINKIRMSVSHWEYGVDEECVRPLRKPPQSWCYVEEQK